MALNLLAVDPGSHICGYALFVEGDLVSFDFVKGTFKDVTKDAQYMANSILFHTISALEHRRLHKLVIEYPVIYPGRSAAPPNDIVQLAYAAGIFAGILPSVSTELVLPTPKQWKGNLPKSVHHKRIMLRLDPKLQAAIRGSAKSNIEHAIDAIGLGQWALDLCV